MLRLLLSEGLSPSLSHALVWAISHSVVGWEHSSLETWPRPQAGLFLLRPRYARETDCTESECKILTEMVKG
jgi:hypothetical protein